jgi:hypothetical protein
VAYSERVTTSHRQNPFPGIDPWMQSRWSDIHTRLISYLCDQLAVTLPDDLVVVAEESIALEAPGQGLEGRKLDVAVSDTEESWRSGERPHWQPEISPETAQRLADPVLIQVDPETARWVEIRSTSGELITVIEILSPSNKTSAGREKFDRKVAGLIRANVNVAEVDLIRGGISRGKDVSPHWPSSPGQIVVMRALSQGDYEVYPCPLRQPIPAVHLPLREGEADGVMDLQPLIDRCWAMGKYWTLKRSQPPSPPLAEEDLLWARERLG